MADIILNSMYFYSHISYITSYALFSSNLSLSAIIAINSLFVGFPFAADTVYPKMFSTVLCSPLPHVTSIAWRMALSTLL